MIDQMKEVERMTQAHLRNVQQLAVFYTSNKQIYAINIAKIKAFIIREEVDIADTPTDTDIIEGIATIRGTPVTLINLDKWLGYNKKNINDYKLIIFCEYNHKQVGFLVNEMLDIVEKTTDELIHSEAQNSKITYTTYVKVDGKDKLCTVFNAEELLSDIGWTEINPNDFDIHVKKKMKNNKKVLVAEDSKVARKVLKQLFDKTEVKYQIFNNGKGIIDTLESLSNPSEEIGLIITDIEMPEVDGYQVANYVLSNSNTNNIPVIVNSSMTTDSVKGKMSKLGVSEFIGKTNIPVLYSMLNKYIGER